MRKAILILGFVAVVGAAAYLFYSDQINKLENMKYDVVGASVEKASLSEDTIINLVVRLTSESTIEAVVKHLDIDILINDVKVGKVTEATSFVIPAKGYYDATFKVTTNIKQAGKNLLGDLAEIFIRKDATVTFIGSAKVKVAGLTLPIPVNYSSSIKSMI